FKMAYPYLTEFFVKYPSYVAPSTAEEGLKDPKLKLEAACVSECTRWVNEYQSCVSRVRARTDGKGNCAGQYEELGVCLDHCVSKDVFKHLK
ncbi:putative ubiquinol-cytochrome c reductase hinge protein, partial [Cardiosporidium cionae]